MLSLNNFIFVFQLSAENAAKQSENDQLSKQLNNLVKHQQELESRTKDLITQAWIYRHS